MQKTHRSGQVFSRVVMPIVLFLVVVAAAAYIIQNVHIFGPKPQDREDLSMQKMLQFDYLSAAWDPDNPDYLAEFENGQEGKFDYPFKNTTQSEIEAGLEKSSCTCTTVKIALIPDGAASDKLTWIDLKHADGKSEKTSILVPVGGRGKVRLGWKGNDADSPGLKNLSAKIWIQPKGLEQSKKPQELTVSIRIVPKVMFLENKVDVGPVVSDSVEKDLLCWSSTRDIDGLQIDKSLLVSGFSFKITPLSKEEVKKFQKEQLDDAKPRIQSKAVSAVKIKVRVEAAKLPFDGPFTAVRIPLFLDGQSYPYSPAVSGGILPSVAIVGCPDGKIHLSKSRDFLIEADPNKRMLTLVHAPINLHVSLEPYSDEGKPRWKLKIVVPDNTEYFPKDSMIVIRSQPTSYYRADAMSLVSALGNLGEAAGTLPAGALPIVGNMGGMAQTWGLDVRLTRVPILKPY